MSCPQCGVKQSPGRESDYHQLLGAVLVHPALKTVLPVAAEPSTRPDGARKNACARSAAKRWLRQLRQDYPSLKILVVEASLSANGPHLELLKELDLRYLIGVKPGDHAALVEAVQVRLRAGPCQALAVSDARGVARGYRLVNDLPLHQAHPQLRVNYWEYWEVAGDAERLWSWITDLRLTCDPVEPMMRGGRARWKIENATCNTLKTQGDALEHTQGHGQQYLATVFALLALLAFLVDQAQELGCRLFQAARAHFHARTSRWERLRVRLTGFYIADWKTLWEAIATGHAPAALTPDTS